MKNVDLIAVCGACRPGSKHQKHLANATHISRGKVMGKYGLCLIGNKDACVAPHQFKYTIVVDIFEVPENLANTMALRSSPLPPNRGRLERVEVISDEGETRSAWMFVSRESCYKMNVRGYPWLTSGDFLDSQERQDDEESAEGDNFKVHDAEVKEEACNLSRASIRQTLSHGLHGQDRAVKALVRQLTIPANAKAVGPENVLFLVGPPGSGQDIVLENLKKLDALLDKPRPEFIFDLSACSSYNASFAINGLVFGYGDACCGQVTDFVRRNPNARVIFRNLHLAHSYSQNVLVQIFSEGILKDNYGFFDGSGGSRRKAIAPPEVNFSQTEIVFETTLGSSVYNNRAFTTSAGDNSLINSLWLALEQENCAGSRLLDSQLLARFRQCARLIPFMPLEHEALVRIGQDSLLETCKHFTASSQKVRLQNTSGLALAISLAHPGSANVAGIRQQAADLVTEAMLLADPLPGETICITIPTAERKALGKVVADLGKDPLRQLLRKSQSLIWQLDLSTRSKSGAKVHLRGIKLEKQRNSNDFGSEAGICIDIPEIRFADIAGHEDVKQILREIMAQMKNPAPFVDMGCSTTTGILFYGPPGTGKTTFAKAVAGESDMPFIATTGTELLNPARAHHIFALARLYAPAVIFIDEIDALGDREKGGNQAAINQTLAEMDGFAGSCKDPVLIIASTNNPKGIDGAFLRSGRLERRIEIGPLDREGRRQFLQRFRPLVDPSQWNEERLLAVSGGMTGAEMTQTLRESIMEQIRGNLKTLTLEQLIEQLRRVDMGERRSTSDGERELIACHEAGHAIVTRILLPEWNINEVSVDSRGNFGGWTSSNNCRAGNRPEIKASLAMLLAGRAAEMRYMGERGITAGAQSDLKRATQIAMTAISELGMDDVVGHIQMDALKGKCDGNAISELLLSRTQAWIAEAMQAASCTLDEHWSRVERLMEGLVRYGELRDDMLKQYLDGDAVIAR